ncbi:outer membrane beta-barrel protein [Pseudochryseolinea flava]|uniref:Outer membrane protein beta-barrel domain-containing protein n=1 Tax=Pseudochryseolinea flava TaxID=2059302 RepID=A0A364Y3A0_9BACT|nr:outer membrane beta-barrel protein [Pseudochryseolinea flava]RAW01266.1 hypothetical protein DQQ10_10160 [Pseudochryseolinea flava]
MRINHALFLAVLTLCLCTITRVSFSQFNYGLRAGGQFVTARHNDDSPYTESISWRPSYHAGFFFSYKFSKRISAVADLLYSDKGYSTKYKDGYNNIHITYLSVPLMAQYHVTDKFSILAGGEFDLFLSAHRFNGGKKHTGTFYDNPTELSLIGGVAYQFNPRLNLMLRYVHGVTNIRGNDLRWIPGFKISNEMFQLSLGYAYRRDIDHEYLHDRRSMFSIGIRQGLSRYVTVTSYDEISRQESSSGRNGYQAEIDFRFTRKRFYTNLGLVYSQKGGPIQDEEDVKQNFMGVPVIIGYSPVKTRPFTFSLEAGLVFNRLMSSSPLPNEDSPKNNITNDNIFSGVYGFEISTDALPRITPFITYRKEVDFTSYYLWSSSEYSDGTYLYHKGQVLSFGVRMKGVSVTRDKTKEEADRFSYRAHMDSVVLPFSFGVKGGINLNDTKHDDPVMGKDDHSDAMFAAHGGMYFQIRLYKRFSLIPEVLYFRKGFKFEYDGEQLKAIANYIEFPVLLSYQATRRLGIDAG